MTLRFVNTALLALVVVLTLTGVYGLFFTLHGWTFDLHRWAAWGVIALVPWKAAISLRSLKRGLAPTFDRGAVPVASLLLAAVTLLVLGLGLAWPWRLGPTELWLRQTAISWHWLLALGLLPPFALHAWRRWPRPKASEVLSRRGALKAMGVGAAGLLGWWAAEALARLRAGDDLRAPRRHTGSREHGSFTGNDFPVTNNPGEGERPIDASTWTLTLDGAVTSPRTFSYDDLLSRPASAAQATLDCTLGWYTVQTWRGVPLADLLASADLSPRAFSVRLQSVSGYAHTFPLAEARGILLATHVGDEPLSHWHGFPLRAVVPSRRGWFWVKWLTAVEVLALG